MNLTDFYFLCAFAVLLIIYYAVPRRFQWCVILISSIAFYLAQGHPVLILYPVASVLISYAAAYCLSVNRKKWLFICSILSLLAVLILLKYLKFTGIEGLLVPLGLSYYTFTLIGYIADVYNGIHEPERNLAKLMAFGMFFPAIVSGPIMQYRNVSASIFEEHAFDIDNLKFGCQRILWGFFKKLVIAQRLSTVVSVLFADPHTFDGRSVWLAVLLFTIQLYADFSGLMDIVLGISECLGIRLPENFKTPFFSKTVSEYWRRWHITLGVWFKEYVFYPVLRSKPYQGLQKALIGRFGKKTGKRIATFAGMFVLWFTVGLWHGGNPTFIIGSGLLHWFYIVIEECLEGPFNSLWARLHIDPKAKPLELIRMVRTFILVNIGNMFFRSASLGAAFIMIKEGTSGGGSIIPYLWRLMVSGIRERGIRSLSDNTLIGISYLNIAVLVFAIILLIIVDVIRETKKNDLRKSIDNMSRFAKCIIWFVFLFIVILFAEYGPGYSSAEFIYQGF